MDRAQVEEASPIRPKRLRTADEFMAFKHRTVSEPGPDPDAALDPSVVVALMMARTLARRPEQVVDSDLNESSSVPLAVARLVAERGIDVTWVESMENTAHWLVKTKGASVAVAAENAFRHELMQHPDDGTDRMGRRAPPKSLGDLITGTGPPATAPPVSPESLRVKQLMRERRMSFEEALDYHLGEEARAGDRVDQAEHERLCALSKSYLPPLEAEPAQGSGGDGRAAVPRACLPEANARAA